MCKMNVPLQCLKEDDPIDHWFEQTVFFGFGMLVPIYFNNLMTQWRRAMNFFGTG